MVRAEEISNRSDMCVLAELERLLHGDECARLLLAELKQRMYRLRLVETAYHTDTYLPPITPACQNK